MADTVQTCPQLKFTWVVLRSVIQLNPTVPSLCTRTYNSMDTEHVCYVLIKQQRKCMWKAVLSVCRFAIHPSLFEILGFCGNKNFSRCYLACRWLSAILY